MASKPISKKRVEYVPPSKDVIQAYVQKVCQRLAEQRGEPFDDPEVMQGLTEFLYILGTIRAKQINHANRIDNDSE